MTEGQRETVEWWVVFRSSQLNHWLFRYLKAPFQHCYAMKKSAGGQMWTIIDPVSSHVRATDEFVDDYPHPRLYAGPNAVILHVVAHVDQTNHKRTFCVFNCVEVVKGLLGIKDFWLWTPRQLYERLTDGR